MLTEVNQYGFRMNVSRTDSNSTRFESKWERIKYMEKLLLDKPHKRSELAKILNVNRSTVWRYINECSRLLLIIEDEKGNLFIDADNNG